MTRYYPEPIEPPYDPGTVIGGGPPPPPPPPPSPGTPTPPAPTPPPPGVVPAPTPAPPPTAPNVVGSAVSSNVSYGIVTIPLAAISSQSFTVQLGEQSCKIDVFQKTTGLYLNLYVSDAAIVLGALCLNDVFLVQDAYLGFTGDLFFIDSQTGADPDYTGLGDRFTLFWVYPL